MFGSRLAPNSVTTDVTVNELWENGQQVIVFYDDTETVNATQGKLWPKSAISFAWPQTDDLNTLQTILASELTQQTAKSFFLLQGVLTPTLGMEGSRRRLSLVLGPSLIAAWPGVDGDPRRH